MKKTMRWQFSLSILFVTVLQAVFTREIVAKETEFFVVIPTYNNQLYWLDNIQSLVDQDYPHWHAYIIDDCSTDGTGVFLEGYRASCNVAEKITIIHNTERKKALQNIWDAVHQCPNDTVVVLLDGDDEFAGPHVLRRVAQEYQDLNTWMTYGQYRCYPSKAWGICCPLDEKVVRKVNFRNAPWVTSHLRTFRASLFKKIRYQDLLDHDGKPFAVAWDMALMFPMLEMAAHGHIRFIIDELYRYRDNTSQNDYKLHLSEVHRCERAIRAKKPYKPL
jgi:glycosyltransferase involved in cell wall biosynthesis